MPETIIINRDKRVRKNKQNSNKTKNQPHKARAEQIKVTNKIKARNSRKTGGKKAAPKTSITQSISKQVEELVVNVLSQEGQYLLPRLMGSTVAPHQYRYAQEYTPTPDINGRVRGAIIVRPNPDLFLEISKPDPGTPFTMEINQVVNYQFTMPTNTPITLDAAISTPNGFIKPGYIPEQPGGGTYGMHFSDVNKAVKQGGKYYAGNYTITPGNIVWNIYDSSAHAYTITFIYGHVTAAGLAVIDHQDAANVAAKQSNTQFTIAADAGWIASAALAANLGIFIAINVTAGPNGNTPAGFQITVDMPGWNSNPSTTGILWSQYSLWQLVSGSDTAATQFHTASRFCTTGLNFLFENLTPLLNLGGSIYAARLPGDSYPVPGTVDGIIALVSSQVHHALTTHKLAEGLHWSYTPEKIQDWLFQQRFTEDPYNGNPLNLPFLVMAYNFVGLVEGSLPSFVLTGGYSLEYLTVDISNTFMRSPCCPGLFELLVEQLSMQTVLSENPEHLKNILKVAKNVVTSDQFKIFAMNLVNCGVKMAPMLLSLL